MCVTSPLKCPPCRSNLAGESPSSPVTVQVEAIAHNPGLTDLWLSLGSQGMPVQDMESALLLDPEEASVIRQFQRAKADLLEHKRLRALHSSEQPEDAGATTRGQLVACKRMEKCVRSLATVSMAHQSSSPSSAVSSSNPVGLGTVLPQRPALPAKGTPLLDELLALVRESDDARLYFRACGGLAATAAQLHASMDKATENGTSVSPLAALLNEACQLDSNLRTVAGCNITPAASPGNAPTAAASPTVPASALLASLCASSTSSIDVAALLHTISTEKDARSQLASAFGPGQAPTTGSSVLTSMLRDTKAIPGPHRALVLAVLSNCATVPVFQQTLIQVAEVENCATLFAAMLDAEQEPATLGHAASLLANVATSITLRKQLAASDTIVSLLVARASAMQTSGKPGSTAALQACLSCLYNLALEPSVKQELLSDAWLDLLGLLLPEGVTSFSEAAVCALGIVARSASAEGMYDNMVSKRLVARVALLGERAHTECSSGKSADSAGAARILESAVRALAVWGGQGYSDELREDAMLRLLVWVCSSGDVVDTCAGNAALCISYVADDRCATGCSRWPAVQTQSCFVEPWQLHPHASASIHRQLGSCAGVFRNCGICEQSTLWCTA